jgi:hypothetical protein
MTARESIMGALATVPGLVPTATTPVAPAPGSAWPRWVVTNYQNGKLANLAVNDYDVFVVLPNDAPEETVEAADGLLPSVVAALAKVGTVVSGRPVAVQIESGSTLPGIAVRLTPRKNL